MNPDPSENSVPVNFNVIALEAHEIAIAVILVLMLLFLIVRKLRLFTIPRSIKCYKGARCETVRVNRSRIWRMFDFILPTKRYHCKTCNQTFTRIVP